jgi:hypothetical protein
MTSLARFVKSDIRLYIPHELRALSGQSFTFRAWIGLDIEDAGPCDSLLGRRAMQETGRQPIGGRCLRPARITPETPSWDSSADNISTRFTQYLETGNRKDSMRCQGLESQ